MSTESVKYELSLRDLMSKGLTDINRKLEAMENNLARTQKTATKTESSFASLGGVWSAVAATGVFMLGREVLNTSAKLESMDKSISFASGSAEEGTKNLNFLRDITSKMPIDIMAAKEGFKTFGGAVMGSSLEGEKARKIFTAVSKAASVMGLDADSTKGIFLALGQMVSKGTVQAEELKGQLGERLPGAFQLAAKAMGLTTAALGDHMKAGMITAEDLLPRLAAELEKTYSRGMASANDSITAHIVKLNNFKTELIEGSIPTVKKLMGMFVVFAESAKENFEPMSDFFRQWGSSLYSVIDPFIRLFGIFGDSTENPMLLFMKGLATALQTILLPAQMVNAIIGNMVDSIVTLVEVFKSGSLTEALATLNGFKNRAIDRVSKPFTTIGDIWETKQKGATGEWDEATKTEAFEPIDFAKRKEDAKKSKEKLAKQVSDVSGGAPKVVNITIEALIKDVKNYFSSSQNAMAESKDFLDQLQEALGNVIADTSILQGNAR